MSPPWLAIDTATDTASVGIGAADQTRAARALRGARQHAAQILPLIQQVLAAARTRLDDIGGIVVGDGPGSFTGLRIAWAAAKGLAHEHHLPVLAVPTLHAVAYENAADKPNPVRVCFDAVRGQVFGAIYAFPAGRLETLVAPGVFTIAELVQIAPAIPTLACLDANAGRYAREIEDWIGRPPVGSESLRGAACGL